MILHHQKMMESEASPWSSVCDCMQYMYYHDTVLKREREKERAHLILSVKLLRYIPNLHVVSVVSSFHLSRHPAATGKTKLFFIPYIIL